MAWFWTIIQLLIRLSASFSSCDKNWIKRYFIQTYHRLSQKYFKSYRIAFRVALWLDVEQLSSYLFVYRRIFGVGHGLQIKRYLIQTYHRLSQEDFKSYRIALFYGLILNNYPVTYSFIGVFFELRYKMLHGIWYKIGGLNQEISYLNLPEVISRVFQVI